MNPLPQSKRLFLLQRHLFRTSLRGRVASRCLGQMKQGISVYCGWQMKKAFAPTKMPGTTNGSNTTWQSV